MNLARKLVRYKESGGDRAAFNDGRRQRKGTSTAKQYDREQIEIIASHAVSAHRGRIAPALRESVENGWVTQPRIVEPMSRDSHSKSYVPRSLREQLRDVSFLHELTKGKRAEAALKPPLTLEYDGLHSMDCIVADDFTVPVYFWIPDGQGWYTLTRGQVILVCDFRTLRVLHFALRPARQYDAATVLRTFRDTFRNFGLPKFILREGGLWRRAKMINALEGNRAKELPFSAAEFEQRMAGLPAHEKSQPVRFVEESEALRGLADLRPQFREAYCARAKPVERVGGLLQDKMGGEPGYCGRDERRDCPEETRKAKLAVESKKVSPQEAGFYSFEQWNDRLGEIVEAWNNAPHDKRARRIPEMSPAEAFQDRFWPHDDPPAQLGPESEFLLATERIPDVPIKGHGISLHNGKFKYCDEQTGARIGQKVIAFFDHLSPETCTFTDVNMKNPFTVARLESVNALHPDERTEKAMGQVNAHYSALKTRFNVLKAKRPLVFRRNLVEPSCFRNVIGALFEFQKQFQTRVASDFAETTIATQVFQTLDAGLRLRRIVMVKGIEGIGKSEAVRNWCARHLGQARYIDLTGINSSKTAFFREIASTLGLPCSESLNTGQLQSRVQSMLQLSGLMLCIDEAHFMFKHTERSKAVPEQIDWIDTALHNRDVPVGLCCTPQFITSMQKVAARAKWNHGQFKRRLKRVANLPEQPTREDLEKVARHMLPKASGSVYKLVVGYAGGLLEHHLDALVDAITEAKEHARISGRENVTFADMDAALKGTVSAALLAKNAIFPDPKQTKQGKRKVGCNPLAEPLHDDFAEKSAPVQSRLTPAQNRAGLVPV